MREVFRTLVRIGLTWLFVWPLVIVGLLAIRDIAPGLDLVWQTLVLTAFLVPLISLVIAPSAKRISRKFCR